MDATPPLIVETEDRHDPDPSCCPDCGTPRGNLPSVTVELLGALPFRRCLRCGTRRAEDGPDLRLVTDCGLCELPFVDASESPADRCARCESGELAHDPREGSLAAAADDEVKRALADSCRFVGSPTTLAYLERIATEVSTRIEGAPRAWTVALVSDPIFRTLALPSGVLAISSGALGCLADESELAFLLAHEVAHAAAGDSAVPLVGLGLRALARAGGEPRSGIWQRAACDLARVGHGDRREHRADAVALRATRELGYDPDGARRFLERLGASMEAGEPALAETALAHPPPVDRLRHLQAAPEDARATPSIKVNRDVFRRAAGHSAIAAGPTTACPFAEPSGESALVRGSRLSHRLLWTAVGVLLLATLFLLFGLL